MTGPAGVLSTGRPARALASKCVSSSCEVQAGWWERAEFGGRISALRVQPPGDVGCCRVWPRGDLVPAQDGSRPRQIELERLRDRVYLLWLARLPFPSRTDLRSHASWSAYQGRLARAIRDLSSVAKQETAILGLTALEVGLIGLAVPVVVKRIWLS
jgi:hypothetical protein